MSKKINANKVSFVLIIILFFILPKQSFASEPIYLEVIINSEKRGDFLFYKVDDDFYIKVNDLKELGLREISGNLKIFEGEEFISLNSLVGVEKIQFDELSTSLLIEVNPKLLDKNIIDFQNRRKTKVYYPENEKSIFLNYRIDHNGKDNIQLNNFYLTNELGINFNNFLILTETFYNKNKTDSGFVRLNSSIYKDDRKSLTRLIIGDFFTPPDPFSGGVNIGGISYSKNYRLDPYLIYRPSLTIQGAVKNKSLLEVYLDGIPIRKEYIPAGEFELRDIYYYQGQRDVEVIIKDPFGRVEREFHPFYFSDSVIKKGISEFSYNLGFIRKNYGIESNNYGNLLLNFYHRYGYSEKINLGFSSEFYNSSFFISPDISYFKPNFGILSFKTYLNKRQDVNNLNYAILTNYSYQKKEINYGLNIRYLSKEFQTYNFNNSINGINYEVQGNIGFYSNFYGSYNVNLIHRKVFNKSDVNEILLGYSKSFYRNVSLYINAKKGISGSSIFETFIGISYHSGKGTSLSYLHQDTSLFDSDRIQYAKNAPVGEGTGYRFSAENIRGQGRNISSLSPYIEYRTPYNIFIADLNIQAEKGQTKENYNLSASGAIIYMAGKLGFTRPVDDSFALIKLDQLKDIPILYNNEVITKTNKEGIAFLPNLSSYNDNNIEISTKKLSLLYSLLNNKITVSPPYRYGSCINFPVKRTYRYEGFIKIKEKETSKPLSFKEIYLRQIEYKEDEEEKSFCKSPFGDIKEKKEGVFFTSGEGDFYIENVKPGRYLLEFKLLGRDIKYEIELPSLEEVLINLGEIEIKIPEE